MRAVGTVAIDESRQTVVTMRSDGYVEDLFVDKTGQTVQAGQPLFRIYSQDIQQALAELLVVSGHGQVAQAPDKFRIDGSMRRLRNLGVPDSVVREVRERGANPRAIDWPAPATGTVISKRIVNGQQAKAGDELYRIVDLSHVWVIADVAERDLADIKVGTAATVTFRAYRSQPVEGVVGFIYPDVRTETRTVRVRIEVAQSGRTAQDRHVCRRRVSRQCRPAGGDQRAGQRDHRQRYTTDRAGRQERRPLRAAPGQARRAAATATSRSSKVSRPARTSSPPRPS